MPVGSKGHRRSDAGPGTPRSSRATHPVGEKLEDRFRLLVESVKDYAIFMLDPGGTSRPGTSARSASRATRPTRSSASTSRSSIPPEDVAAGKCELELEIADARGPLRGRGLARSQGRLAVLGQRHHHGAARPERHADRLREGHPRPDRAPARPSEETPALSPARRERARTTRSSCSTRRPRRDLEPRRRAHQGVQGRRDHRQALLGVLSPGGRRGRQVRARARGRRRERAASRRRAGACARTARASGPTS